MSTLFDEKFLSQQKEKLLHLRSEILNQIRTRSVDDLQTSRDDTMEDGDQAQVYLNQSVSFGLRERELRRLRDIETALAKIDEGTYGICEDTDEPIGKKRLEKMPWARLSIQAAEEEERKQMQFGKTA